MPGILRVEFYTSTMEEAEALEELLKVLLPPFLGPFSVTRTDFDSFYDEPLELLPPGELDPRD
jgi:hypothetical protein